MILLILTGCSSKNIPDGFPELYPVSITVSKGGLPLSDATVCLLSSEKKTLSISGITDESGVANIQTAFGSFITSGAPEGSYKVTISHFEKSEYERQIAEASKLPAAEQDAIMTKLILNADKFVKSTVPDSIQQEEKTPIEINIEKKSCKISLDVDQYN